MTDPAPTKVLIVEDSPVMQRLLVHAITADRRLAVVGTAFNAGQAMELLRRTRPDVVSMDIRMPGMNGLELTRKIMQEHPVPIVIVAADIDDSTLAISMNALKAGALAVVEKPKGVTEEDWEQHGRNLCTQLRIMSQVKVIRQRPTGPPASDAPPRSDFLHRAHAFRIVGIGSSTGGPGTLANILGSLSRDFPLPILVVQHIGASFVEGFSNWLGSVVPLPVKVATDGLHLIPGTIYVAPGHRHLSVRAAKLHLEDTPPVGGQKPSIDHLFNAMVAGYGSSAIGVLLTGMGEDGARGLFELRRAGGHTIAEHESSAVVWGMPGAAVRLGAVVEQLPADLIGGRLQVLAGIRRKEAPQ